MIGRGKLFLNSRVENLLYYVAITRASGFRASFIVNCETQILVRADGVNGLTINFKLAHRVFRYSKVNNHLFLLFS